MRSVIALTLVVMVGCADTTAIVRRTDGPPTEAVIDSSDASTLRLGGPTGNMLALGQYQVASIDHPGNVMALIGGCYAGAGLLATGVWLVTERRSAAQNDGASGAIGVVGAGGILATIIGLAVFVPNMVIWGRSKVRAHAFESGRPPDWMIPPPVPDKTDR
jgi:hypothetical protein